MSMSPRPIAQTIVRMFYADGSLYAIAKEKECKLQLKDGLLFICLMCRNASPHGSPLAATCFLYAASIDSAEESQDLHLVLDKISIADIPVVPQWLVVNVSYL